MRKVLSAALSVLLLLSGCGSKSAEAEESVMPTPGEGSYMQITQEEAKTMMDTQDVIILDVRERDEYDEGHISGAVLLPVGTIGEETASAVIPEKDATVLVYCRSGNRSKKASETLVSLGYTGVYEFGGIKTWPYEIETE